MDPYGYKATSNVEYHRDAQPPITPRQAATALNVDRITIYAWIKAGRLAHCRLGPRCIRIPASEIVRLLRVVPSNDPPSV